MDGRPRWLVGSCPSVACAHRSRAFLAPVCGAEDAGTCSPHFFTSLLFHLLLRNSAYHVLLLLPVLLFLLILLLPPLKVKKKGEEEMEGQDGHGHGQNLPLYLFGVGCCDMTISYSPFLLKVRRWRGGPAPAPLQPFSPWEVVTWSYPRHPSSRDRGGERWGGG